MAQFQTWFGSAPYLAIGIQLMPITVASEGRDQLDWAKEMYPSFEESCGAEDVCVDQGWSVLMAAVLASIGHRDKALKHLLAIPASAFLSAGGNGHSLSNSIWYVSTRPDVEDPYVEPNAEGSEDASDAGEGGGGGEAWREVGEKESKSSCRRCTSKECASKLNVCPSTAPFVCLEGPSAGGCTAEPWEEGDSCTECCEFSAGC